MRHVVEHLHEQRTARAAAVGRGVAERAAKDVERGAGDLTTTSSSPSPSPSRGDPPPPTHTPTEHGAARPGHRRRPPHATDDARPPLGGGEIRRHVSRTRGDGEPRAGEHGREPPASSRALLRSSARAFVTVPRRAPRQIAHAPSWLEVLTRCHARSLPCRDLGSWRVVATPDRDRARAMAPPHVTTMTSPRRGRPATTGARGASSRTSRT